MLSCYILVVNLQSKISSEGNLFSLLREGFTSEGPDENPRVPQPGHFFRSSGRQKREKKREKGGKKRRKKGKRKREKRRKRERRIKDEGRPPRRSCIYHHDATEAYMLPYDLLHRVFEYLGRLAGFESRFLQRRSVCCGARDQAHRRLPQPSLQ